MEGSRARQGIMGEVETVAQNPKRTERLLTGRANRRRLLAGIAAAGLAPMAADATKAAIPIKSNGQRGANMARLADRTEAQTYLTVPGARLYHEVAGSGPVLLLIPGGMADADGFAPLAGFLEANYTVVRYDPRGISRSRFDGPVVDVSVEVHADDAGRLLAAIGGEPAYVLGHSGGAVIGLALAVRHSEQVRTLVAHEPPLVELLPEGDERRKAGQEIYETYLREGAGPAMEQFMAAAGMDESSPPVEMSPEAQEFMSQQMARMEQNLDFFFAHYLLPITSYVPDVAALREGSTRVVVGVGEDSVGQETYDTALALAERLGTPAATFPGDHVGMATQPEAFAERLHGVLQAS
jgi:pimeloyl-ACP methyl ester carboxylesterase